MTVDLWVLDWSGTISNDGPSCLAAINSVFRHYHHREISWNELQIKYSADLLDFYGNWGIKDSNETFYRLFKEAFKLNRIIPTPIPKAVDTVKTLAKFAPVAIFSSHPDELLKGEIQQYGLGDTVTYKLGGVNKAQTSELDTLLRNAGANPQKTVYVGDTHVDITLGHRVGTKKVAVVHELSYQTLEGVMAFNPAADAIINGLHELVGILPRLDL